MIGANKVSAKNAKQALELVITEDREPEAIIAEKGWEQITDSATIAATVAEVMDEEEVAAAEAWAAIVGGNQKRQRTLTAFLVGKALAKTGGRADPKIVGEQVDLFLKETATGCRSSQRLSP
jgi:aspartyl-tRNA(Asn)/glutamyl-tRNA(Gln) amidotransferase subunit B